MRLIHAAAALALASPAVAADAEDAAAVAVAQRFFDALAARDTATMREIVLPGTVFTSVQPLADGTVRMSRLPADETFAKAIDPGLEERMWKPVVVRRGPLATVTAPYEFRRDGKTTHCGIDTFTLVKADGAWKIASLAWTREPDACAELKR